MRMIFAISPATARRRRSLLAASLVMLCASAGIAATPDDPRAAQRAEFQQAIARTSAAATGSPADSASLQDYVLYPYLQAARLEQALRRAGSNVPASLDEQIAGFLRTHQGQPVAQELRRSWLTGLASRTRWEDFLAFHDASRDSLALRCHGYAARIALQRREGLAAEVRQTWLTPRSVPECDRAFTWLADSGELDDALIEQRVRLALEAGSSSFARQIAARLPPRQAAPLLQWAALLDHPQREIDALLSNPGTRVETAALLAGWAKYARADRSGARQRYPRLLDARKLDHQAASRFALALALPLSWDRDADALEFFARVEPGHFDDTAHEWHARAALWAGDWRQAGRSIAAMSEDNRRSARWRYWSARVAAQQGDDATARQLYESIQPDDNYYSAMAAARLGRPAIPHPLPIPPDAALLAEIEALPPFTRARELLLSGMAARARAEWRFGQDQLSLHVQPQTIHLAARWGWHQHAVSTATGQRVFFDYALLYPRPYDAEVAAAAEVSGLAPSLIYGVIRQESLYQSDAVSGANARGLMQLLLETARRTARQWNLPAPTTSSLAQPAANVMLGATHLKDLLGRFGGQLPLALAGYNAGPGAAQRWLPAGAMDPDIWIENIPYNETRNYVQRILWHTVVFSWLQDGEAQDTSGWLRPVTPP